MLVDACSRECAERLHRSRCHRLSFKLSNLQQKLAPRVVVGLYNVS